MTKLWLELKLERKRKRFLPQRCFKTSRSWKNLTQSSPSIPIRLEISPKMKRKVSFLKTVRLRKLSLMTSPSWGTSYTRKIVCCLLRQKKPNQDKTKRFFNQGEMGFRWTITTILVRPHTFSNLEEPQSRFKTLIKKSRPKDNFTTVCTPRMILQITAHNL